MVNGERNIEVLARQQIVRMERDVIECDPNTVRLIRSATLNNFRAFSQNRINEQMFSDNNERISNVTNNFLNNCLCIKKSLGI